MANLHLFFFLVLAFFGSTKSSIAAPLEQTQRSPAALLVETLNHRMSDFISNSELTQHFDEGAIRFNLGRIDSRLKLRPCQSNLSVEPTQADWLRKNASFKFRCDDPGWAITLPVIFEAHKMVWFSKRHILKNQMITRNDIEVKLTDVLASHFDFFHGSQQLDGMIAKRTIKLNAPIFSHDLIRPKSVKRNDKVSIIATTSNFRVTSKGMALEDGFVGDSIKVKNLTSQRVIVARIKSAGVVVIHL